MYYVVNPDGSKYGPGSKETMQQWHREGRIAPDAWFEDAATEMRVLRADVLPEAPTTAPPAVASPAGAARTYAAHPQGHPHAPQGQAQMPHPQQGQQPYGQQPYGQQPYGQPNPQNYGQYNPGRNAPRYGDTPANIPGKITVTPGSHSAALATVIALFTTFGGALFNKQFAKGAALFGALVVTWLLGGWLTLPLLIAATVDAYKIAERLNRGEAVDQWQFF